MKQQSTFEEQLDLHGHIIFPNVGVSMMPLLRENRDLMIIEKKGMERCKKYDAVLFKRDNGQYVMHRVMKVREQDYIIIGDNCVQKEVIREEQILGILTGVIRDGKEISVTDKGYLLYVHLWCDFFPIRAAVLHLRYYIGRLLRRIGLRN